MIRLEDGRMWWLMAYDRTLIIVFFFSLFQMKERKWVSLSSLISICLPAHHHSDHVDVSKRKKVTKKELTEEITREKS